MLTFGIESPIFLHYLHEFLLIPRLRREKHLLPGEAALAGIVVWILTKGGSAFVKKCDGRSQRLGQPDLPPVSDSEYLRQAGSFADDEAHIPAGRIEPPRFFHDWQPWFSGGDLILEFRCEVTALFQRRKTDDGLQGSDVEGFFAQVGADDVF